MYDTSLGAAPTASAAVRRRRPGKRMLDALELSEASHALALGAVPLPLIAWSVEQAGGITSFAAAAIFHTLVSLITPGRFSILLER